MKIITKRFRELKKLAIELDEILADEIPHLVGVSVEPDPFNSNEMTICVQIDDISVKNQIPKTYRGNKIKIKVIQTPSFAKAL